MSIVGFAGKEYRTRGLESWFGSSSADDVCLELVRVGVEEESVVRWKVHIKPYQGESQLFVTPFQGQVKFARGECGAEVWIRVNEIAFQTAYFAKQRDKIAQEMFYQMWGPEVFQRPQLPLFEFEVHLEAGDMHTQVETVEEAGVYASATVSKRPLIYTPWHYLSWYILKSRTLGVVITLCILYILFGIDLCNMYLSTKHDHTLISAQEFAAFVFLFELLLRCGVGGSTYTFTTKCFLDVAVIIGLFLNLLMGGADVNTHFEEEINEAASDAQYGRILRSASRASRVVKLPQLLGYLTDASLFLVELLGCVAVAYMKYNEKQQVAKEARRLDKARRKKETHSVQLRVSAQAQPGSKVLSPRGKRGGFKGVLSTGKIGATTELFKITAINPAKVAAAHRGQRGGEDGARTTWAAMLYSALRILKSPFVQELAQERTFQSRMSSRTDRLKRSQETLKAFEEKEVKGKKRGLREKFVESGRSKISSTLNIFRGVELMQQSQSYRQLVEFVTNKLVVMLVIVQVCSVMTTLVTEQKSYQRAIGLQRLHNLHQDTHPHTYAPGLGQVERHNSSSCDIGLAVEHSLKLYTDGEPAGSLSSPMMELLYLRVMGFEVGAPYMHRPAAERMRALATLRPYEYLVERVHNLDAHDGSVSGCSFSRQSVLGAHRNDSDTPLITCMTAAIFDIRPALFLEAQVS
jgi:hypothetical protein